MDYQEFLKQKQIIIPPAGIDIDPKNINSKLFQFQKDIDIWALKKGRAAIFAGCGLGKTPMQLEWSNQISKHTGENVLILAPLAVSQQTVKEGQKFGIEVTLCRSQADVKLGINITNYEMLQHFEPDFAGLVLDESSILKSFNGTTRNALIDFSRNIPFRLACTATPVPNDHMELGNHAEFLGICSYTEMLATFFVHDGGDTAKWRLKGHAVKKYWEWVASWAVMMQRPSDLGYSDEGFILPPLNIHQITIPIDEAPTSGLFAVEALTLQERQQARRDTVEIRAEMCAEVVNQYDEPFIAWCNLNSEADELKKQIKNNIEVRGSDSVEQKEKAVVNFLSGTIKKFISKPSIFGFGLNLQHCCKMAFVGLSDSFEQYYQAVRRCWRFGQVNPVDVYIIVAETEGAVVANIKRKEAEFEKMLSGMIAATQDITKKNIHGMVRESDSYNPQVKMKIPEWLRSEAA